jgi:hypothetical protein
MKVHTTGGVRMRNQGNRMWIMAPLALLTLSLHVPAGARGPSPRGFGPPGFAGPGHADRFAGGLLERLVSPCRAGCLDTAHACYGTAETTALTCVQAACTAEIEAAQSACATDRTSPACQEAVSDLRMCGDTCLDTLQAAVTVCRDALGVCRDTCDSTP